MAFQLKRISISMRRKLESITLAIVIFAILAGLATHLLGRPVKYGVSNGILTGIGVSLFEEFYVQTLRGRWLRSMHPLRSTLVYAAVVAVFQLIVAEGDYVIAHGRFSGHGRPAAWIAADIVRFEDGKLAEHWDVLQDEATKAQSTSGLPMFGDRFPA
jgi:hypothetical protein